MDPVSQMRESAPQREDPVSCFFLVQTPTDGGKVMEKIGLLRNSGLSDEYLETIEHFLVQYLGCEDRNREFRRSVLFFLRTTNSDKVLRGLVKVRNMIGKGVEVELIIPGTVAAQTPDLFVDGFFTAFLPPGFYAL